MKRWHWEAAVLFAVGWFSLLAYILLNGDRSGPMLGQRASAFDFLLTGGYLPIVILAALLVGVTILGELKRGDTAPVNG